MPTTPQLPIVQTDNDGYDMVATIAPPCSAFDPIAIEAGQRLDEAAAEPGRIVLLCGPAGTGKTTMLAEWAHHSDAIGRDNRWCTLSDRHNDAAALWRAVRNCLRLPALPNTYGSDTDPIEDVVELLQQLAEPTKPLVLIVDNAHLLTDPLALAGVDYFLEHCPPGVTPVLAGRSDPPLRWHALAMSGRLVRLGSRDLAFTTPQIDTLLRQHHCHLSDIEVGVVQRLTQGWAALVRLVAISLSDHPGDRATALAALTQPPHAVADFLVGELLTVLSEDTVQFLLVTAVPTAFTPSLAAELGESEAARHLDRLERIDFPIQVTDADDRLWFAYHPMLRSYLLAELSRRWPEQLPELHHRAARWYLAAGKRAAALPHVLAGPDTHLSEFLREHAPHMVFDGFGPALFDRIDHLDRIPDLADDPFVWLLRVADAVERGDHAAATAYLDLIGARDIAQSSIVADTWLVSFTDAVTVAATAGATTKVDRASTTATHITGQPDMDCYLALYAGWSLLGTSGGKREDSDTQRCLHRALALADQAGLARLGIRAADMLAISAGLHGAMRTMGERAEHALDRAQQSGSAELPEAGNAAAIVALAAYLRGENPEMPAYVGSRHARAVARIVGFANAEAPNELAAALHADMRRLLDTSPTMSAGLILPALWTLLRIQAREPARTLVDHARAVLAASAETAVALAALAEYQHRPIATLEQLEPWLRSSAGLAPVTEVTAWLLSASACHRLDRTAQVYRSLRHAVHRAADDRLIRPFLDVAGTVQLLDAHAGRFGHHDRLVETIRTRAQAGRPSLENPLTEAELTVLRQLPSGQTTQQVARDLSVSINTVKTHLRSIYHKLGAASRAESIAKARKTGLL